MNSLTPRQLFDISVLLNGAYPRTEVADHTVRIGLQVHINIDSLVTDGPSRTVWERLIGLADNQGKVIQLLTFIQQEKPDNQAIRQKVDELQNGIPTRVRLLADAIRANPCQCVLFLGPGVLQYQQDGIPTPFSNVLADQLAREMDGMVYFDKSDQTRTNLNYIVQRYLEQPTVLPEDLGKRAKDFYEEGLAAGRINDQIHQMLAQLPFRLIINTNPDSRLVALINEQGVKSCSQRYYNVANSTEERLDMLNRPSEGVLHYNIFGSFENTASILFTESQLLNFTKRIIRRDPPLDPAVLREFDENKLYLFLGFDFDQWSMKIMFDMVLQLVKKNDRAFSIFPQRITVNTFNREFFEKEFQMYFIQKDLIEFLTELIRVFKTPTP